MRKAVGFVEIKSIPVGIQTADEMVKAGNVELLLATPICPGKYVIIVGGHVGPVKAAMSKAELVSGIYLIDTHILDNIREEVLPAIAGVTPTQQKMCIRDRVESLFHIRHEDGTVQFFEQPLDPNVFAKVVLVLSLIHIYLAQLLVTHLVSL